MACMEDVPVAAPVAVAPSPAAAAVAHELQGKSAPDLQLGEWLDAPKVSAGRSKALRWEANIYAGSDDNNEYSSSPLTYLDAAHGALGATAMDASTTPVAGEFLGRGLRWTSARLAASGSYATVVVHLQAIPYPISSVLRLGLLQLWLHHSPMCAQS